MTPEDTVHPVDRAIGRNLRAFRTTAGFSQKRLGEVIGVKFQQVQKYENGHNRIACSTLYDLATFLNKPVEAFYAGLPLPGQETPPGEALTALALAHDLCGQPGGGDLARAYIEIPGRRLRERVVKLVRAVADDPGSRVA